MLRQLTALEAPSLTNFTPQRPFVQSTSHLRIIIWSFSESECAFVEMRHGSSVARTAVTLLMFPLGSVILVHMMPQGQWPGLKQGAEIKT